MTADQIVTAFLAAVVSIPIAMMLELAGLSVWAIFVIVFVVGISIGIIRGHHHGRGER
jgi:hypothetical protein